MNIHILIFYIVYKYNTHIYIYMCYVSYVYVSVTHVAFDSGICNSTARCGQVCRFRSHLLGHHQHRGSAMALVPMKKWLKSGVEYV